MKISDIKRGCGIRLRVQDINTKCGGEVGDIGTIVKVLCPTCQAKLTQAIEQTKEEIEFLVRIYGESYSKEVDNLIQERIKQKQEETK